MTNGDRWRIADLKLKHLVEAYIRIIKYQDHLELQCYWAARREHAARLRAEKMTYAKIGRRLGITGMMAKNLVVKASRRGE